MSRAAHIAWRVDGQRVTPATVRSAATDEAFGGFFIRGSDRDPVGAGTWIGIVVVEWVDDGAYVATGAGQLDAPLGTALVELVLTDGEGLLQVEADFLRLTLGELRSLAEMLLTVEQAASINCGFGFTDGAGFELSLPTASSLVAGLDTACPERLATGVEHEAEGFVEPALEGSGSDGGDANGSAGDEEAEAIVKARGKAKAKGLGVARSKKGGGAKVGTVLAGTADLRGVKTIAGLATALQSAVVEPLSALAVRVSQLEHGHQSAPRGSQAVAPGALFGGSGAASSDAIAGALVSARGYLASGGQVLDNAAESSRVGGATRSGPLRSPAPPGLSLQPGAGGVDAPDDAPNMAGTMLQLVDAIRGLKSSDRNPGVGPARTVNEFLGLMDAGDSKQIGVAQLERIHQTVLANPGIVTAAGEQLVMQELEVLPGDAWSYKKFAKETIYPEAPHHKTLMRAVAVLTEALDRGRRLGGEHQHAFLLQALKVFKDGAISTNKDLGYAWPVLGIADPGAGSRPLWTPQERVALAAFHRDESTLAAARQKVVGTPDANSLKSDGSHADASAGIKKQVEAAVKAALKGKAGTDGKAARDHGKSGAASSGDHDA
jgi:hypothetical protein